MDEARGLGLEHTLDKSWDDAVCYFEEGRKVGAWRACLGCCVRAGPALRGRRLRSPVGRTVERGLCLREGAEAWTQEGGSRPCGASSCHQLPQWAPPLLDKTSVHPSFPTAPLPLHPPTPPSHLRTLSHAPPGALGARVRASEPAQAAPAPPRHLQSSRCVGSGAAQHQRACIQCTWYVAGGPRGSYVFTA